MFEMHLHFDYKHGLKDLTQFVVGYNFSAIMQTRELSLWEIPNSQIILKCQFLLYQQFL